jgi:hypothetical protein
VSYDYRIRAALTNSSPFTIVKPNLSPTPEYTSLSRANDIIYSVEVVEVTTGEVSSEVEGPSLVYLGARGDDKEETPRRSRTGRSGKGKEKAYTLSSRTAVSTKGGKKAISKEIIRI